MPIHIQPWCIADTQSWAIVEKVSQRVVFETNQVAVVLCLNTSRYTAIPIRQWLQYLNRQSR